MNKLSHPAVRRAAAGTLIAALVILSFLALYRILQPRASAPFASVQALPASADAPPVHLFQRVRDTVVNRFLPRNKDKYVTLIATGDIMLGRSVEMLENQKGWDYPFLHIDPLLDGADIVMGNLEGPIPRRHIVTPLESLQFSFAEQSVEPLSRRFSVLSLANNHTDDFGETGFRETKSALEEAGIVTVGHPVRTSDEFTTEKTIHDRRFRFIGLNATYPSFNINKTATLAGDADSPAFTIITIHWGTEYAPRSNETQRSIAHALIDAGADLIIGHHPHVVQEIERYKGRLIFYSLGNFIFDQYFSRATQESLMVRAAISDDTASFTLIPLALPRSQPAPMTPELSQTFLNELASRSASDISDQIKSGTITVENTH